MLKIVTQNLCCLQHQPGWILCSHMALLALCKQQKPCIFAIALHSIQFHWNSDELHYRSLHKWQLQCCITFFTQVPTLVTPPAQYQIGEFMKLAILV